MLADGVQARLLKGQSPVLGVTYNVLQIPEEVLRQIWLLAHAAWHDFSNFDELKEKGIDTPIDSSLIEAAYTTAKAIAKGSQFEWPSAIPRFREIKEGVEAKAIREIFAMSCAWAILHEFRHAQYLDDPERPTNSFEEELACDRYAATFLLSEISAYCALSNEDESEVRAKRAMGALVGLYFVARLTPPESNSNTHPPVKERMKLLFDAVGTLPSKGFWSFSTALLWGIRPSIASMPITVPNPSSRDLAYLALSAAFEQGSSCE